MTDFLPFEPHPPRLWRVSLMLYATWPHETDPPTKQWETVQVAHCDREATMKAALQCEALNDTPLPGEPYCWRVEPWTEPPMSEYDVTLFHEPWKPRPGTYYGD